ncbi:MAG: hypothetical protein OXE85_02865, partial [Roseovarius sp.]|nr:hypothetical protein [Roseovarius sp.]
VDLEAAMDLADAIAEIGVQARPLDGVWDRIKGNFTNFLQDMGNHVEELEVADMSVGLRAGINAGNWQQKGDAIFAALASSDQPVILALDELPILFNRLLRDDEDQITVEGRRAADAFLSWLRRAGQAHRGQVIIILSGSVGLEPLLEQARPSAHANIFSAYDLEPWSEKTAVPVWRSLPSPAVSIFLRKSGRTCAGGCVAVFPIMSKCSLKSFTIIFDMPTGRSQRWRMRSRSICTNYWVCVDKWI